VQDLKIERTIPLSLKLQHPTESIYYGELRLPLQDGHLVRGYCYVLYQTISVMYPSAVARTLLEWGIDISAAEDPC